ncbi:MAG: HD family phosphohydrolase, partial [Simplicispira sp.]|nr:HD family phosphohydrolase [Simplicispira sp.]
MFSKPHEAFADADQLVQHMLDALLADKSIAIHLMNDKIAGEDTYFHSLNVSVLSMMLAKELRCRPTILRPLVSVACFHDIGKVEIPARIVNATLPSQPRRKNLLQLHCQYGLNVVSK